MTTAEHSAVHERIRAAIPALPTPSGAVESGPPAAAMPATAAEAPTPAPVRPRRAPYALLKRAVDAVVAALGLLVLAPLLAALWVAVRIAMGSPVLFRQERVTVGGRRFRLLKFRTMLPVDPARGWVTDADRLTRFGAWLRATSLDELPSLWNILVGDMSVVGPRPLPTGYEPFYSPAQAERHSVRAGLTGLAQVSGRNNVPWDERFDLDQRYVRLMGPLVDMTILARSVRIVLRREGIVDGDRATATDFSGPLRTPRLRFVPVAPDPQAEAPGSPSDLTEALSDALALSESPADGIADHWAWDARTPSDALVAHCVLTRHGQTAHIGLRLRAARAADDSTRLDLAVGLELTPDRTLLDDLATLLVTHARVLDCTHLRVRVPVSAPGLLTALRAHGFVPGDAAPEASDAGTVVLTSVIGTLDAPLPDPRLQPTDPTPTPIPGARS